MLFWRIRTGMMFMLMTFILVTVGMFVGYIFDATLFGLIVMICISVLVSLYSYYGSKSAALRAYKVHLVTEAEEPRLYGIVKKLAEKSGLPMPEVGVSDHMIPNAFATGRNPKNAAVVATRGILQVLSDEELEGVFAHEMSHVKNRDILVMSVVSCMASVISYVAQVIGSVLIHSGNISSSSEGKKDGAMLAIIGLLLYTTVPIAAMLVQLGVSRNREFLADEAGGRMTGNPRALAKALMTIEKGGINSRETYDNQSYSSLLIANPLKGKRGFTARLFSTHPPMEARIERLNKLADELDEENRKKNRAKLDPNAKNFLY